MRNEIVIKVYINETCLKVVNPYVKLSTADPPNVKEDKTKFEIREDDGLLGNLTMMSLLKYVD
jgi:hypothetical protein